MNGLEFHSKTPVILSQINSAALQHQNMTLSQSVPDDLSTHELLPMEGAVPVFQPALMLNAYLQQQEARQYIFSEPSMLQNQQFFDIPLSLQSNFEVGSLSDNKEKNYISELSVERKLELDNLIQEQLMFSFLNFDNNEVAQFVTPENFNNQNNSSTEKLFYSSMDASKNQSNVDGRAMLLLEKAFCPFENDISFSMENNLKLSTLTNDKKRKTLNKKNISYKILSKKYINEKHDEWKGLKGHEKRANIAEIERTLPKEVIDSIFDEFERSNVRTSINNNYFSNKNEGDSPFIISRRIVQAVISARKDYIIKNYDALISKRPMTKKEKDEILERLSRRGCARKVNVCSEFKINNINYMK